MGLAPEQRMKTFDWLKYLVQAWSFLRSLLGILERAQDQAERDRKAAEVRSEVEDENSKLTPDDRRDALRKWVRDG